MFDFDATTNDYEQEDIEIVPASEFGSIIEFDESFTEYLPTLLEGGRIGTIESNDTYGWLLTRYEPVYDPEGNCVAYVGADISIVDLNNYVKRYIIPNYSRRCEIAVAILRTLKGSYKSNNSYLNLSN